jgi:hypothetical protein
MSKFPVKAQVDSTQSLLATPEIRSPEWLSSQAMNALTLTLKNCRNQLQNKMENQIKKFDVTTTFFHHYNIPAT